MAGRNADIRVTVKGDADFGAARREAKDALDDIEREAKDVKLSPELDTAEIRKAIALAEQLDGMVATLDIDADPADIVAAEKLARSLRGFQARVDLSVEGKAELTEALGLADKMEGLRKVRVEVQGRQDLERAQEIADDLERRRTVPIDAQASDLVRLDDQVADALRSGGEAGAGGVAGALGGIDFADIGGSAQDELLGSLAAAGPWAAAAGTIGAVFGDEFLEGFNNALPSGRADTIRALRNNLSDSELEAAGVAGGEAYSSGLSDGLTDAKDAAALIQGELGKIDDSLDLTGATRQATALATVFDVDVRDAVTSVDKLLSQGLVRNSEEGFNLLFELAQQTGTQFDEMLELTDEFSVALRALGIEGPQGLKLIGQMVERGIFPQVDQAGEVFEEFNEQINTGGAAEGLELIGLNAEDMLARLRAGGPDAAKATAEIAQQLLATNDNAVQASASASIFGGNMDLLGDDAREAALQLFATADGTAAVGSAATDAADAIEGSASGLDRLKKVATELGNELGGTVADGIDTLNSLAKLDFGDAADSAASFGDALGIKLLGPLGELADRVGLDPFGPLKDSFDELTGKTDELPPKLGSTIEKMGETADASDDLADGFDGAAASADELDAQLRGLFDFSADQLLRDIADAADDLAASFEDGAGKTVGLGGAIDITTDSGRRLQDQMEGLTDKLIDAQVAAANNEITAGQLADTQSFLASEFDRVTGAAGLTTEEVEGLRQKYLAVPSKVTTDVTANTQSAINNVTALQNAIANIKSKSVTISASISGPTGISASGSIARRARGGWTDGLTLVGEEGPELIDVRGRAFVHTAAETRELLSNRGGAFAGPAVPAAAAGPRVNIEQLVVDKGVDLWQALDMAELVYGGRR